MLNLPKYYVQRLQYVWVWLKQNVPKCARVLSMPEEEQTRLNSLEYARICLKFNVKDTVKLL